MGRVFTTCSSRQHATVLCTVLGQVVAAPSHANSKETGKVHVHCHTASLTHIGSLAGKSSRRPFSAAGLCYTHRHRKRGVIHCFQVSRGEKSPDVERRRRCLALSVHILGNGGRHLLHSTWTSSRRYGQTGARALPRNLGTHLVPPTPMYHPVPHAVPSSVPHRTVGPQTRQGRETAAPSPAMQLRYLRID